MPCQLHVPDFVVFLDDDDRPPLRVIGVGVRVGVWVRLTLTVNQAAPIAPLRVRTRVRC